MRIEPYLHLIPEIEDRIRRLDPDAIVIGLGPSAHLLPWIDQELLQKPRRFGVHDVFRILPVDDLIVMDPPKDWLHEDGERFKTIINSRPKRWWFYPTAWDNPQGEAQLGIPFWKRHMPPCVLPVVKVLKWENFEPGRMPTKIVDGQPTVDKDGFVLDGPLPQTTCMSPVGATTLAWHLGCRRIGVIGMDAVMASHPSHAHVDMVSIFMRCIHRKAQAAGGAIWNLSPISQVRKFDPPPKEQPPTSGSAATSASVEPVPSAS